MRRGGLVVRDFVQENVLKGVFCRNTLKEASAARAVFSRSQPSGVTGSGFFSPAFVKGAFRISGELRQGSHQDIACTQCSLQGFLLATILLVRKVTGVVLLLTAYCETPPLKRSELIGEASDVFECLHIRDTSFITRILPACQFLLAVIPETNMEKQHEQVYYKAL